MSVPRATLAAASLATLAWLAAAAGQARRGGLNVAVDGSPAGIVRTAGGLGLEALKGLPPTPAGHVVSWRGVWSVAAAGAYELRVRSAVPFSVTVGGQRALWSETGDPLAGRRRRLELPAGDHALEVEARASDPDLRIRLRRKPPGGQPGPFVAGELLPRTPSRLDAGLRRARRVLGPLAALAWLAAGAALTVAGRRRRRQGRPLLPAAELRSVARGAAACLRSRAAPRAALAMVVLYGAALRAEAVITRYGPPDTPGWARKAAAAVRAAHPADLRWSREEHPYKGDPSAYARHARQMESFYEPRFREPMFVFLARLGIVAAGGRDLGISLASAVASVVLVAAIGLLAATAVSPWAGVLAAAAFAIDEQAIALASEGWRDETFAVMITLFAWGVLRLYDEGRFRHAVLLGLAGGLACLTRITGLSVVVPIGLLLAAVPRARAPRRRWELAVTAVALSLALVAPFMGSCWIAYGDPFHSIHGVLPYYIENRQIDLVEYFRIRLGRPWDLLDTALVGATGYPFLNKWNFDAWWPPLAPVLAGASVVGLMLFLLRARTRLLVAILAVAVAPFVFTWKVGSGDSWRLTLVAYPFYLAAAGACVHALARLATGVEARAAVRKALRDPRQRAVVMAVAVLAAALPAVACLVNALRAREEVAAGRPAVMMAGPRDALFFTGGWHRPVCAREICLRYTRGRRGALRLPLEPGRAYHLVLRMDPLAFPGMPEQVVAVRANGHELARLPLQWDPERTGTYRVRLPAEAVGRGSTRLELEAAYAREAGEVDAVDELVRDGWVTAFSVWYVGVYPMAGTADPPTAAARGTARRDRPGS